MRRSFLRKTIKYVQSRKILNFGMPINDVPRYTTTQLTRLLHLLKRV